MTPERLAEIQADDARYIAQMAPTTAEGQRRELLAEIQRLTDELDRANGSISAIRGWATSRLEILHHPQHLPHSSVHAAQAAVLNDLIRVLDHLAGSPEKAAS